jgi:hypothetical protein
MFHRLPSRHISQALLLGLIPATMTWSPFFSLPRHRTAGIGLIYPRKTPTVWRWKNHAPLIEAT